MKSMTLVQTMARPSSFGMSVYGFLPAAGLTSGAGFGGSLTIIPTFGAVPATDVVRERRLPAGLGKDAKHAADWGSPAWRPSSC
jgi:hypothetical protein